MKRPDDEDLDMNKVDQEEFLVPPDVAEEIKSYTYKPKTLREEMIENLTGVWRPNVKKVMEAVESWNYQIEMLEPFDYKRYRSEILSFDTSIPSEEIYDIDALAEAYSRITNIRTRLAHMFGVVNSYAKLYKEAQSNIYALCLSLTETKLKDTEKKSIAESMAIPYSRRYVTAQGMVDYIKDLELSTQLASVNLANLMREREAMAKINRQYVDRGNSNIFAKSLHSSVSPLSLSSDDDDY